MNNFFIYRLILVAGQITLLCVNHFWPFWHEVVVDVWVVCGLYLASIITLQSLNSKEHQSANMVVVDIFHWAGYFYFLGGVSNPLIWCLLIPSVLSSLSQSIAFTWLITFIANTLYLLLWYVTSQTHADLNTHNEMLQQHVTGMWMGFIAVSVLLTWVTTTLMKRVNETSAALLTFEKQRQADENIIKMATLATSTAHELGTPLASIKLLLDDLKLSLSSDTHTKDFLLLDSQLMRCKKVLEELTALTAKDRLDESQLMVVKVFVEKLISSIDAQNCEIKYKIKTGTPTSIEVDTLLRLAFTNVLNNSITAGASLILLEVKKVDGMVVFAVKDNGQGRTHQNQEGLGIGLKLSRRIINSIGGELMIEMAEQGAKTVLTMYESRERNYPDGRVGQ